MNNWSWHAAKGSAVDKERLILQLNSTSPMRSGFFSLLLLLVCTACGDDAATPAAADDDAAVAKTAPAKPTGKLTIDGVETPGYQMSGIDGFNYITDCDSLLVSTLELTDAAGEGSYSYLLGSCATNKSYDWIAVPRAGHTPSTAFSSSSEVLAKARTNDFADYLVYAFEYPKLNRVGQGGVQAIYPANVLVYRLDKTRWNRLGADRAEDEAGLNSLRWNVLHDQPLKFQ